jgi:uncharacterized protein
MPLDLMSEELPQFRYHPAPLVTGMVEPSSALCECCQQVRGFIYVGSVYGERDLQESLCPWCIADGSASTHLGASFIDDIPLRKANLHESIIEEVHLRTPAFTSWQQEEWLTHCNDACEYHGDASVGDIQTASEATKLAWQQHYNLTEADWFSITESYAPGGNPAFYKFICRHCSAVLFGWDCT